MIKKLALALVLVVLVVLAYAATKPATMHVERTATINASPDKILPLITDFRRWGVWSPYERLDPAMKKTYTGADTGRGAVYEWEGNSDVGQGRMEIIEVAEPSRVTIKVDFVAPVEGHDIATFRLVPAGNATTVSWMMDGPNTYLMKVMGVAVNMDNMIGKDFETGLVNLKAAAEQ